MARDPPLQRAQSGYHLGIFSVHGDDWESYKHMRDGITYKFPNMSCSPNGNTICGATGGWYFCLGMLCNSEQQEDEIL